MPSFDLHTEDTAPAESQVLLNQAMESFGFVPNLFLMLAESPALLEGYISLMNIVSKKGTLTEVEQQVVFMTSSFENECTYCMAGHTGLAKMSGIPDDVVEALRNGRDLADPKLQALRVFTAKMVTSRGNVTPEEVDAFIGAGFTKAQVLEVILGISMKTMSNYANHVAKTPVDGIMQSFAWVPATK